MLFYIYVNLFPNLLRYSRKHPTNQKILVQIFLLLKVVILKLNSLLSTMFNNFKSSCVMQILVLFIVLLSSYFFLSKEKENNPSRLNLPLNDFGHRDDTDMNWSILLMKHCFIFHQI